MFAWVVNLVRDAVDFVLLSVEAALAWMWSWLSEFLDLVVQWFEGLLPPALHDFLAGESWSGVVETFDLISWCFPVYGVAGVWATALGICGSIRLARWIKSFVPTISG